MNGTKIIVSAEPRGRQFSGIVSGTPKPGTHMEIVPATSAIGGHFTFRASTDPDGNPRVIIVLLEDDDQGFGPSQAFVNGTPCKLYCPAMGEELNMLMRKTVGTGTLGIENVGDELEVDGASGMLQAAQAVTAGKCRPWTLLEHLGVALTVDTLVWVMFNGSYQ